MDALFLIGIGVLIGWHVPMPPWATFAINFIKTKAAEAIKKNKQG